MGAAKGNKNPEKFKTPALRQKAFKAFCTHIAKGLSAKSFYEPCVENTIIKMIKDYPAEFDMDELQAAKAQGIAFYEQAGIAGMMGRVKGFNAHVWQCNMFNRAGWSNSIKHSGDTENPLVVIRRYARPPGDEGKKEPSATPPKKWRK